VRLEKQVQVELRGQDILVDPEWIGPVFSNLGHLLRNSVDHGIEAPDERGDKPPCARIMIACRETADGWTLEVSDDGRGIDLDAVVRAALQKGKVTEAELAKMSTEQKLQLIFMDGVTTKEAATEDSGRGVGMTAFRQAVLATSGTVEISTASGKGTKVLVRVPRKAE
jgi:chemotaxis protein histidine kinase CheA